MTADDEYIGLLRDVLQNGASRDDRTGVGTLSVFGRSMRFDLTKGFPLLTTKRVFFRGVVEELLWMLNGKTDAKELDARGVKIWNGNGSRGFLDRMGLPYPEGELGPVYGFQWRHFGASYRGSHADYRGEGTDQVREVLRLIREDPHSRRIVLSAWNPAANKEMALPACHCMCQFYVDTDARQLSCQMYQRSADIGLGVPFNIASYALLTHIIAKMCGLEPKELVHVIGDAHVYKSHIDALRQQLSSPQGTPPRLEVLRAHRDIEDYTPADFVLTGYAPSPGVRMEMAV